MTATPIPPDLTPLKLRKRTPLEITFAAFEPAISEALQGDPDAPSWRPPAPSKGR